MYSRKYYIDSATSLIEQVQIKREQQYKKELETHWKLIEKEMQNLGIARTDIMWAIVSLALVSALVNRELTIGFAVAFITYITISIIVPNLHAERPKLSPIIVSQENLEALSEYFINEEQKNEFKKTLKLFKINWDIDLDQLKFLLNLLKEQIDANNSTAWFPDKPIDLETIVARYRPAETNQSLRASYSPSH